MENKSTMTQVTADIIGGVTLQLQRSIKTLEATKAQLEETPGYFVYDTAIRNLEAGLDKLDFILKENKGTYEIN